MDLETHHQPEGPPYWHSSEVLRHVSGVTLVALLPVIAAGVLLFGLRTFLYIGVATACAAAAELFVCKLLNRRTQIRNGHTVVLATILALAVPPTCGILIVACGAVLLVVAKQVVGGLGHYLWHPVLVARAVLCFMFPVIMVPDHWPVLNQDHLATGDIASAAPRRGNNTWFDLEAQAENEAWTAARPARILADLYNVPPAEARPASESVLRLVRDKLPPALDCLLGTTGGGIGETSVIAILLGGVFLVYRSYVHWTLPVFAILGLVAAAAILPIPGGASGEALAWWPIRLISGNPSLPVGFMLVAYHLIVGEFMFAIFFVASDMTASPFRTRGHAYYGFGIGVLTVALRMVGFATGSTYWAILIINTLIPAIDRLTRRRVYGT
ncbi:MAG: RnfABCDGE type electron transport complex subunit D [Planctomycetes bacterium]|nr:RnfABCDGE type electron transport complex subunit D [Planctomycetota bacterium]